MRNDLERLCFALSRAQPVDYYEEFNKWVLARAVSDALAEHAKEWVDVRVVVADAVQYLSPAYSEQSKREWALKMLDVLSKEEVWDYTTEEDMIDCKSGMTRLRSVRLTEEARAKQEAEEKRKQAEAEEKARRDEAFKVDWLAGEEKRKQEATRAKVKEAEEREAQRLRSIEASRLADLTLPWLLQQKEFFGEGVWEDHITAFLTLHGGASLLFDVVAELVRRDRAKRISAEHVGVSTLYRHHLAEIA